jgi:hypothetical protein
MHQLVQKFRSQPRITHTFLDSPNFRHRNSGIATCSFNLLRWDDERPPGKVLLVERGEKLSQRLLVVVLLVELELLHEPYPLVGETC